MTSVANELRALHSPSYITDQLYLLAKEKGENCVIESIRTPGEIVSLRQKGNFYLFAVDADPEIRYRRITIRKSETDDVAYETFISNEKREFETTDPKSESEKMCMADFIFTNDGNREDLYAQVETVLQKIVNLNSQI